MTIGIRIRLSVMMFLQFFVWGSWFVTLGTYLVKTLGATGAQTGMVFATQSWGAIVAPFIVGLIADRYFNAERMLAVLHLAGAVILFELFRSGTFDQFYPLVFAYMVVYMPTLALVNSVAFRQMRDPSAEFSTVRVWGTIGWILAGLSISLLFAWDSREGVASGALANTFLMAAVASLALGLFSATLPRTPPRGMSGARATVGDLLGFKAITLLRDRNFLAFFIAAILRFTWLTPPASRRWARCRKFFSCCFCRCFSSASASKRPCWRAWLHGAFATPFSPTAMRTNGSPCC